MNHAPSSELTEFPLPFVSHPVNVDETNPLVYDFYGFPDHYVSLILAL